MSDIPKEELQTLVVALENYTRDERAGEAYDNCAEILTEIIEEHTDE